MVHNHWGIIDSTTGVWMMSCCQGVVVGDRSANAFRGHLPDYLVASSVAARQGETWTPGLPRKSLPFTHAASNFGILIKTAASAASRKLREETWLQTSL
jgi:hypothetical protein